jgi:hypothetical protein
VIEQTPSKRLLIVLSGLAVLALIALGWFRLRQIGDDPEVPFLRAEAGAQWIKLDTVFNLNAQAAGLNIAGFRRRFEAPATIEKAWLTVRAMKRCRVILDGEQLYISPESFDTWKQARRILIPFPIRPGMHELILVVENRKGPPAVLAYSDELGLRTGPDWEASLDSRDWTPAWPVSRVKHTLISREFPSALRALVSILPWLVPVFVVVFTWSMWSRRFAEQLPRFERWRPRPHHVRWALLLLWSVLALNNIFEIPVHIGFDVREHMEYIGYIVQNRSLPLATDGWQMFQSPLYYLINVPVCALFADRFNTDILIKVLRIIPLICGLLQIEIVYRSAKLVFPDKDDLQTIATVIGGLMPMHIYICQVVGNEPFAGFFVSLVILLSLGLLTGQSKSRGFFFFVVTGLVLGLAVLSKVTAILLVLPLTIAVAVHGRSVGETVRRVTIKTCLVFGTCFATAGWYYIRNWIELGKPFISGWDLSRGIEWWQDPGYRTWSQLVSFGESLTYPVYSGAMSLWDAVYSTLWLDSFISGLNNFAHRPPWNDNFMLAGALFGLVPTMLLFAGVVAPLRKNMHQSRKAILFCVLCVAVYFAAILELYVRLPIYSTAKATYTLGLLPCYGLMALIACWGVAAYVAYFVV